MGRTQVQCLDAFTLRRYSFGLRLAIAKANAKRTQREATMKRVDAPWAWASHSDLDKKESDELEPAAIVAPHDHRGAVRARGLCK